MTVDLLEKYVQSEVENLHLRIDILESTISSIDHRLEKVERHVILLYNAVEDLKVRIGSLETRIDAIEQRMDALEQQMGTLEAKVDALIKVVDSLSGEILTKANAKELFTDLFKQFIPQIVQELRSQ